MLAEDIASRFEVVDIAVIEGDARHTFDSCAACQGVHEFLEGNDPKVRRQEGDMTLEPLRSDRYPIYASAGSVSNGMIQQNYRHPERLYHDHHQRGSAGQKCHLKDYTAASGHLSPGIQRIPATGFDNILAWISAFNPRPSV